MRILILYQLLARTDRGTITEHLYSFRKNSPGDVFCYVNIEKSIPSYLQWFHFDAVIFHYTFLAGQRFFPTAPPWEKKIKDAGLLKGYKVAIPQDEYDHTDRLNKLFKEAGVNSVYTCFTNQNDIENAYPFAKSGVKKFFPVFTGYVDESKIDELAAKALPYRDRPIDIGYRARKLPAYFGRHGQLKYELVDLFNSAPQTRELVTDIKNTNDTLVKENKKVVKLGSSWYDFLLSCKAFIGCEGGSSLLDPDGAIQERIKKYTNENPDAGFEEIEKACFPGKDYNISCFALSPRHFESVMTRTLQILVEGEYSKIFIPWVHYVPLKRDFSNMDEIFITLQNNQICQELIDNAYRDIVLSRKYTYNKFVESVLTDIRANVTIPAGDKGIMFSFLTVFMNIRNALLPYYISAKIRLYPILTLRFLTKG